MTLYIVPLKEVCFEVTFEGRYAATLPDVLWEAIPQSGSST
jgi:hypothetical protein